MSCCGGGVGQALTDSRSLQWNPQANATTAIISDGISVPTVVGTATARAVTNQDLLASLSRVGYVSAVAINSVAGPRGPQLVTAVASQTGQLSAGPFRVGRWSGLFDFGISDAVLNAEARMFVGWSANTGAPTAVDPATLTDAIGFGQDNGDANLHFYSNSNGVFSDLDLGAGFPIAIGNVFRVIVECLAEPLAPGNIPPYRYKVINAKTGAVAAGSAPTNAGPRNGGVGVAPRAWRATGPASAIAVGIDLIWMRMKVQL